MVVVNYNSHTATHKYILLHQYPQKKKGVWPGENILLRLLLHFQLQCAEKPSQDDVIKKLEQLGHKIGERLVERVSRDTPRFKNELDAVVFICKSFWMHAFNKQVDNLKTNHQVGSRT